jgi:very-short-patch-repair endonuclease
VNCLKILFPILFSPSPKLGEGRGEGLLKNRARELRKNMTDAERWLWQHLRNRDLSGFKFRRQRPVGPYIVDLVCLERRIVIEIDGGQHVEKADHDEKRSQYLREKGFEVIRFWNHEVLQNGEAVLESIYSLLRKR